MGRSSEVAHIKKIKNIVFNTIRDDDENNFVSNIVDGFIIALIIINVAISIAETFSIPQVIHAICYYTNP